MSIEVGEYFIFTPMATSVLTIGFQQFLPLLDRWDKWLFLKVNTVFTNPVFDAAAPWWREANTWIPFYLFLVLYGVLNFGRKVWPWILMAVVTLVITDQISSHVIKLLVERTRPCNEPELAGQVRLLLNNCSGTFSFTSSHAANHVGFSVFLMITLKHVWGKWRNWLLVWAFSVAYAQVYVGIHYPLDVIGGALLGAGAGMVTGNFFNRWFGIIEPPIAVRHDQQP